MNSEYGTWDEAKQEYSNPVVEHINSLIGTYLETEEVREIAKTYKQKCKDLAKQKNFEIRIPS
jgi:predicted ATP-grasp superfamily ATP-dependent carboligase